MDKRTTEFLKCLGNGQSLQEIEAEEERKGMSDLGMEVGDYLEEIEIEE